MKMKPVTLEDIAAATGGRYCGPDEHRADLISGVCTDNRKVESGSLFVCIKGARADGHSFAKSAVEAGAACCLAEEELDGSFPYVLVDSTLKALRDLAEWYRSLLTIPVIGVIGSVGKTTAKELTACVLGQRYNVLKTSANLNNEIGVPLTLLSIKEEHEVAVVEMGISDFGEMRRLAKMAKPDICIMTTIGYCHLENLGDLDGVLKAKGEVFEYMKKGSLAVLNGDDDKLKVFTPDTRIVRFGLGESCDVRAENVESLGFEGISCNILYKNERVKAVIPAFGTHIIYGVLAAAAVAVELGMDGESIAKGLTAYEPVGGRANVSDTGYITLINDCYNANPNSMSASITSLASITTEGKRIAILGDMKELGAESSKLHREMGVLAANKGIELVICIGDEAKSIYEGCVQNGGNALYYTSKEELYEVLDGLIAKDDVVLVKASHSMGFEEIVERLRQVHGA